ncbi:Retrovirus-related Pol polyprotein from transposon TNT 1-94 [Gossypium australe]|uniref:Retrovirus-related Pol polyprotein from transposon TNT 1-94 n=1 Tax=Gossypium australe TaxID=47621 RepID=A0A5B6V762_9ROSI|nr:Retrovirus-related Pol polyprotein from transposon TNT 1-94 [Gossypium australe]
MASNSLSINTWMSTPLPVVSLYSQQNWFAPSIHPHVWSNPFVVNSMPHVSAPGSGPAPSHSQALPQALFTTLETVGDNTWYPDSGASHHLTHSSTSLSDSTPYNGSGKVYMGNGNALPIRSTGQSSLITRSRPLFMKSILFVTGITKNLLYVSKFTKDNKVMFEFLPKQCWVRDLQTNEVLLQGSVHNGLYKLDLSDTSHAADPSSSTHCFAIVASLPLSLCHSRLNGLVERKHRQIVEAGLSMLAHASMPLYYWNDAFSSAVYLINRLPSSSIANVSPYEKLFQTQPNYSFLRVFGCLCFPNLRPYNTHKLQFRSTPCTFLGYSPSHKGYHCQDGNGKVYISRHVTFLESSFRFKTIHTNSHPTTTSSQSSSKLFVMTPTYLPTFTPVHSVLPRPTATSDHSAPSVHLSNTTPPLFNPTSPPTLTTPSTSSIASQPTTHQPPAPPTATQPNSHAMAYLTSAKSNDTPVDIHEAIKSECWQAAVHSELQALLKNNTWSLCSLPTNRRAVGCKRLFKAKKKKLMGLPVVRATTIRVVLSLAVMKGWSLRQTDVNNAFLNSDLTEDIYMEQPPGFEVPSTNGQQLVCKLNKALYGLRQAPRAWFHTLKQYLITRLNFNASKADPSLFIRTSSENVVLLMVYVDDIVITSSSNAEINSIVQQLHSKFTLKDMGQLNFFLGIEVQHTPLRLFLSQKKYVLEILAKTGMEGAAATPIPMVNTPKLTASDGSPPSLMFIYIAVS